MTYSAIDLVRSELVLVLNESVVVSSPRLNVDDVIRIGNLHTLEVVFVSPYVGCKNGLVRRIWATLIILQI